METFPKLITPGFFGNHAAADVRRMEFDNKNSQILVTHTPVSLCFIGDSVMQNWELDLYFQGYGLMVNRGIEGDIAEHLLKRFEADVLQLHPRLCIVMIGLNDTWSLNAAAENGKEALKQEEERIFHLLSQSYRALLCKAKANAQPILMESLLPVRSRTYRQMFLCRINRLLQTLCAEFQIPYLDYHTAFSEADGLTLRRELSWDGVHPYGAGYQMMAELLRPYLDRFFAEMPKEENERLHLK